jgi:hypothetical protein
MGTYGHAIGKGVKGKDGNGTENAKHLLPSPHAKKVAVAVVLVAPFRFEVVDWPRNFPPAAQ